MGYCYLCEKEWIGYISGGYFCEECERLKNVVKCLGSEKINRKIRFKMDVFDETKPEKEMKEYNTRSKNLKV